MNIYQLRTGQTDEKEAISREAEAIRKSPNIRWLPLGLKFIRDTRGSLCLSCVVFLWAYNSYFIPILVLIPAYQDGQVGMWAIWLFMFLSTATVVSLIRACLSDPGYMSFDIRRTTAEQMNWSHCKKCLIQRPLKSHHCSRCQRCVRRMDHHCPWINSCVGEDNQWVFVLLLFYGLLLSTFALLLDALHFYYFKPCMECDQDDVRFRHSRFLMYGCFVSGVILGFICFTQLFTQLFNIYRDKTTVESLIYGQKPIHERPPVTKTPLESFRDVFGRGPILLWLNPFRKRRGRNIIVYAEVA